MNDFYTIRRRYEATLDSEEPNHDMLLQLIHAGQREGIMSPSMLVDLIEPAYPASPIDLEDLKTWTTYENMTALTAFLFDHQPLHKMIYSVRQHARNPFYWIYLIQRVNQETDVDGEPLDDIHLVLREGYWQNDRPVVANRYRFSEPFERRGKFFVGLGPVGAYELTPERILGWQRATYPIGLDLQGMQLDSDVWFDIGEPYSPSGI